MERFGMVIVTNLIDTGACDRSHTRPLFLRHRRPELCADWLTG